MQPTKMYILIAEDVPDKFAPVIAAHASLAAYLKWENDDLMVDWLENSFRKVVCRVNKKEFENMKTRNDALVMTESALEGREVAIVCLPTKATSPFGFFKLWKPVI